MKLGARDTDEAVVVVAEIGINHNGDLDTALSMIREAANAGADAVKFQVGTPRLYVNRECWADQRETPWGIMPYIEYRERLELDDDQLRQCQHIAHGYGLEWFASPLDVEAVDRLEAMGVPFYKVASPMLTDLDLMDRLKATGKPVILSSGMTTYAQLDAAVARLDYSNLAILHCTSEYPCPPEHNNLRCIETLRDLYPGRPIGYSGHEIGIPESIAAAGLGACIIERHLTLSRAMWGSDQAASLEPEGLRRLIGYVRTVEKALGDGQKVVHDSEQANMRKFRKSA